MLIVAFDGEMPYYSVMLRQEDDKFEASLGYGKTLFQNKQIKTNLPS
jgi:hypothetical protein